MTAFATVDDLALLTGRTFTAAQEDQATALLDAASAYLRGVIGQDVYPRTTSTYTAYPLGGREDLPQWPVFDVVSVERDGEEIPYIYRPGYIKVSCDDPVDITFTWGHATVPPELTRLTCVLVAQSLAVLEAGVGLNAGGISSVAIDDFKVSFAEGGAGTGMTLTPHAEASVRQQFGRGAVDVAESVQ
jgi:hypothetical protein